MGNVNGEWIMQGVSASSPDCLHSPQEVLDYIDKIGFLPLFSCGIPGFSVEEHTEAEYWWSDVKEKDPWQWRMELAASGKVAYGKFFAGRAGFISKEWIPTVANWKRDGYDFDALWDDRKAKFRQKQIMDCFAVQEEYYTFELRNKAGLSKPSYFDQTIIELQNRLYLVNKEFRCRINKKGQPYGWPIAILTTPESLWGRDYVTSSYREKPIESYQKIVKRIQQFFPGTEESTIEKLWKGR